MTPVVLIASTSRWFSTVRLAMGFRTAGFEVDAVCPVGHPVGKSRAVRQSYRLRGLVPVISLRSAITRSKPDLIVPTDDPAARALYKLYCRERRRGNAREFVCTLIARSLGPAASFPFLSARSPFMQMAEAEGVRVPPTRVISDTKGLSDWIRQTGFPVVLKTDHSSGATGVRIVYSVGEAERVFRKLQAPQPFWRTIVQTLAHEDGPSLWRSLLRRRSIVNAQTFVGGRDAISEVACWHGRVLAGLHFEVLGKQYSCGPASVIRLIDNSEMSSTVEKIARRLNLSGLYGFDFILGTGTSNAYLLEMNPRATQIGHLTLGPERDLPAALYAAVSSQPIRLASKLTENEVIALFPQEWARDPMSPFLQSAYHDVPWESPELVLTCVSGASRNHRSSEKKIRFHDLPRFAPSHFFGLQKSKLPGAD